MHEPLGPRTLRRIATVFPRQQALIGDLLVAASDSLRINGPRREATIERIHFAILKISNGSLERLQTAIELDWRDALVGAGFGDDAQVHLAWLAEVDRAK